MRQILYLVGLLVVLHVARKVLPFLIAHAAGRAIGKAAVAKQPDTIHLVRASAWAWKDADAANAATSSLRDHGFRDAGIYSVTEMPGMLLRLLVNEAESAVAVFYEHPVAGRFADMATRYEDGGSLTDTSNTPTGLEPRPDHDMINMPSASLPELFERLKAERRSTRPQHVSPDTAVAFFENAYAESIAWRKKRGVSAGEVVEVARRRKNAA